MTLDATDVFHSNSAITKIVEKLNEVYPPLNPGPGDPLETIMYRAGQRQVVEYLQTLIED